MSLTPEKAAAYEEFEAALAKLIETHDSFSEGQLISGWVVIVNGTRALDEELDGEMWSPDDDEFETVSSYCSFTKRGQTPTTSRGIIEAHRDRQKGFV